MREIVWLSVITAGFLLIGVRSHRRWNRIRANYVQMQEYADTLLQYGQGMILNVQAIVSDLQSEDPVRVRVEAALSRAEQDLSELRETMEPHCLVQQHDTIG